MQLSAPIPIEAEREALFFVWGGLLWGLLLKGLLGVSGLMFQKFQQFKVVLTFLSFPHLGSAGRKEHVPMPRGELLHPALCVEHPFGISVLGQCRV